MQLDIISPVFEIPPFVKALGPDRYHSELTHLHTEKFGNAIIRNKFGYAIIRNVNKLATPILGDII
jgi:hypothetical protein